MALTSPERADDQEPNPAGDRPPGVARPLAARAGRRRTGVPFGVPFGVATRSGSLMGGTRGAGSNSGSGGHGGAGADADCAVCVNS